MKNMERLTMNYNSNNTDNNYSVIKYCSVYKSDKCVTFVEEDGRTIIFQKNNCKINVSYTHKLDQDSKFVFKSYGIIGSISYLEHVYLLVVTEARKCGRLFHDHDVYSLKDHRLIPLFHPIHLTPKEREFLKVFNEFEVSNNFYFSYTYNLSNSLRLNLSLKSLFSNKGLGVENELFMFDPVLTDQKYCYNFSHKNDLCQINENCFNLSLNLIHGYFCEFVINVTGRNLVFTLISRRSRFYSGTRYQKRGITGTGHVANDVETEQILYDWNITKSVSSFVLIRGSTPIFWSQDPNETIIKKPPIFYTQNDPTNSSSREHFKELMSYYGSPIVVLNLLLDNPSTDEGRLSLRYQQMIEQLNNELPKHLKIHYFSKNIKSLLEKGVAKQMLKEVVDIVHEQIKLTFLPTYPFNNLDECCVDNLTDFSNYNGFVNSNGFNNFGNFSDFVGPKIFTNPRNLINGKDFVYDVSTNAVSKYKGVIVQNGVIRISCLDCLDRTSAFAKHMSLSMFKYQLELIGINVNYEKSITGVPNIFPNTGTPVSSRSNRSSSLNHSNSGNLETEDNKENKNKEKETKEQNQKITDNNKIKQEEYNNEEIETERENIIISDYYGFNHVRGLLFEVLKERYEKMCDVLSMQYAGSNALKKYEGQNKAISISTELFTTVKRRYRNYFEDAKIQVQTNAFLCSRSICKYSELGFDISQVDLDPYIHFRRISMEFSNVESFLIPLTVNSLRLYCLFNNNNNNNNNNNSNNNNNNNKMTFDPIKFLFYLVNETLGYSLGCDFNSFDYINNTNNNKENNNNNNKENNNNNNKEKEQKENKNNKEVTKTIRENKEEKQTNEKDQIQEENKDKNIIKEIETQRENERDEDYKEEMNCQLYKDLLDKECSFYKIIRNYLTIEDSVEGEYVSLAKFKPSRKVIKIVNMVSDSDYSEGVQFFKKFSSVSITNVSNYIDEYRWKEHKKQYKEKEKDNKEENKKQKEQNKKIKDNKAQIPIQIKNNSNDYSKYLVPEYTYNPENWSLIRRSNIESLNKYIHIVT